jgi:hypothetical protein
MSPSFIGTQPEAFHIATKKYRPLAGEIDDAFALMGSLTPAQREQAIVSGRRGRIQTGPGKDGMVPEATGVSCATFDSTQRQTLLSLIAQWVNDLPPPHAEKRMNAIEAEIDKTRFSWRGPTDPVSDVSYTIQGPSVMIEYACQDLGGDPLNHLHSMYRDPTNDYGQGQE